MTDALTIGAGAILVALSLPLLRRRVRPNGVYGLRVPATFADEWVWYEANAKTGRDLTILGVVLILLGLGVIDSTGGLRTMTLLGGVLIVAAIGWLRANRLLKRRPQPQP